ncbi:MAG: hypothetical protein ACK53L_32925, partial [Pirellulaceae bacterium]
MKGRKRKHGRRRAPLERLAKRQSTRAAEPKSGQAIPACIDSSSTFSTLPRTMAIRPVRTTS